MIFVVVVVIKQMHFIVDNLEYKTKSPEKKVVLIPQLKNDLLKFGTTFLISFWAYSSMCIFLRHKNHTVHSFVTCYSTEWYIVIIYVISCSLTSPVYQFLFFLNHHVLNQPCSWAFWLFLYPYCSEHLWGEAYLLLCAILHRIKS